MNTNVKKIVINQQNEPYKKNQMERQKLLLIDALGKNHGIVTRSCAAANIPRANFYRWYREDPAFKKAALDAEEAALDYVESKHYDLIEERNPASIIFHLKTKGKNRGYIERSEVEYTGNVTFAEKSDEELKNIINN